MLTYLFPIGYFLSVILFFYLIGFVSGLCADTQAPRRRVGANFICTGTAIYFTFGFIFWLLTTLLFITGASVQKLGCDTLEEPSSSDIYEMFESDINDILHDTFNNSAFDDVFWNISESLDQCLDGQSLYTILQLDEIYDVDDLEDWTVYVNTSAPLEGLRLALIDAVADVSEDLKVFEGADEVEEPMKAIDDKFKPLKASVLNYFNDKTFTEVYVDPMNAIFAALISVSNQFEDQAIQNAVSALLSKAEVFNETLNNFNLESWGPTQEYTLAYEEEITYNVTTQPIYDRLSDVFNQYIPESPGYVANYYNLTWNELSSDYDDSLELFNWFARYSIDYMKKEVGYCRPFYEHVYQATINYSCYKIVDPLNSVWSGIGLILVCSVPFLFCAGKVESIYRRYKTEGFSRMVSMTEPVREAMEEETGSL